MGILGDLIKNNQFIFIACLPFYRIKAYFEHQLYLGDERYLKKIYEEKLGKTLNIDAPLSFNEKMQWLKIHDRTKLHTACADKLFVKSIIDEKIGPGLTAKTYFVTKKPSEITLANIKHYPAVIKTNHDQGTVFILKSPSEIELRKIRDKLRIALAKNHYPRYREWQYKDIDKKIYVEEYIKCEDVLNEFKFLMAKEKCIAILHKKISEDEVFYNWYSSNWSSLNVSRPGQKRGSTVPCPKNFSAMIEISKKLGSSFNFSRIDIYQCRKKLIVGEITFHPAAGLRPFVPDSFDFELGNKINL